MMGDAFSFWLRLDSLHMRLMDERNVAEESLKSKSTSGEGRQGLEECARGYLSCVSHVRKFCHEVVADVIKDSVTKVARFDANHAVNAFRSLELYAQRLHNQPWRVEQHSVLLYTGYFVHNIKKHLYKPERMLHLMGYVSTMNNADDEESEVVIFQGQVDVAKVHAAARDCLLAAVECQILAAMVEATQCTWSEALRVREKMVGDVDDSVDTIMRQRSDQRPSQQQPQDNFSLIPTTLAQLNESRRVPVANLLHIDDNECYGQVPSTVQDLVANNDHYEPRRYYYGSTDGPDDRSSTRNQRNVL